MAMYRERLEAALKPLLCRGFAVTELKEVQQNFGDTRIVLASDRLQLRFTSDRGQLFVDIAPPQSENGWYDLSEFLKIAGLRSTAGPWESAQVAIDEIEKHESLITSGVGDHRFASRLVKRR